MSNLMGRPPNLFSAEQVVELGKDLISWLNSKEGKSNAQWVNWYFLKHDMFREDWHALIKREDFRPYYNCARQLMANNIMLNKDIAQSYGNRYLHRYDDELNDDEEAARDREAIRGKEQKQSINTEQLQAVADCLSRFHSRAQPSEDTIISENHSE